MKIVKISLLFILLNWVFLGCKENVKDKYPLEIGKLEITPEDLVNKKNLSKREYVYHIYELQLVTGNVLKDTLTFDCESNYINDRLTVYADKVVYARILKDSVIVL